MNYRNPIIRGFKPDPSVCKANGKYYLACSSFHFFPGVPLFESSDLVNWEQIGFCLTREAQIPLDKASSSGGIYAPTIRYNNGRFYMAAANVGHEKGGNFYVWTDDIYGEWSDAVFVDQGGIDPSLFFEDGKTYFMSNGIEPPPSLTIHERSGEGSLPDEEGKYSIFQCEIDIETGKKLTESKILWYGTGGRYLEAPHLHRIGNYYFLLAAEGGTEYGHMVVCARSEKLWGPYKPCPGNPILTNRNLGGYPLQGIGHADLIEDDSGNLWMYILGFRQIQKWLTFHHLGRETCMVPISFSKDEWLTVTDGIAPLLVETYRIPPDVSQSFQNIFDFKKSGWEKNWQFLRTFKKENYLFEKETLKIKSVNDTLDTPSGSPAFICHFQKEFEMELNVTVTALEGEAGISVYMDENHHYDLALVKDTDNYKVVLKLNIGDIKYEKSAVSVSHNSAKFVIRSDSINYHFYYCKDDAEISLGSAQTRYLSSEVAGGFTGAAIGLYSQGSGDVFNEFSGFECRYGEPLAKLG